MKSAFAVRSFLGDPGDCSNLSSSTACFQNLTAVLEDALSPAYAASLRCTMHSNAQQRAEKRSQLAERLSCTVF